MGFGVSLITVSPNTTIKSSDANTNWQNLNNATYFTGDMTLQTTLTVSQGASISFVSGGRLSAMNYFSGSGAGTFNHGLGAVPNSIQITYAGNFGGPPTNDPYYYNANATNAYIVGQGGYSWIAIAYRY